MTPLPYSIFLVSAPPFLNRLSWFYPHRRPRARRPAPSYTIDMGHRSALTPPQQPPTAHREAMHICSAAPVHPDPTT